MTTNPWENAFDLKSGTARLNSHEYFDVLLGDDKTAEYIEPQSGDVPLYTVDTNLLIIKGKHRHSDKIVRKTYASTKYTTFFAWLKTIKAYTNNNDPSIITYHIMNSMKERNPNLFNKITNIFNTELKDTTLQTGSSRRRRRHSRKYKKSKRLLRRKSRSTRRR